MAVYPIQLTPDDNGTVLITCESLPEVTTYAESEEAAGRVAQRAIEEALAARMAHGEDIPPMSRVVRQGRPYAPVRSLVQMKTTLYDRLRDRKIKRADLAKTLGWNRNSVDRLFQLEHQSRPDQLDEAFVALGWPSSIDAITNALDEERAA